MRTPSRRTQQTFPASAPRSSIPGTEPPVRALFIDRWGTLLAECDGSAAKPFERTQFTPGAVDALFKAAQAGWKLYLVGNEDAVARGKQTDSSWAEFEAALLTHLRERGVLIERNYACLDHPQGKGEHKRSSVFRFPETGVFFHASQNDGVALSHSWVIGDSTLELVAGTRAGCRALAVKSGLGLSDRALDCEPHVECENLAAAIEVFLQAEAYARH